MKRAPVPIVVAPLPVPVTTTTTTTRVKVERTHWVRRSGIWLLAPFVDDWNGLSLNRFLSVVFAVAAVRGPLRDGLPVTGWNVAMGTLAGALAFSKEVFIAFLNRKKEDTA